MNRKAFNVAVIAAVVIFALIILLPKFGGLSGGSKTTGTGVASNTPAAKALAANLKSGKPTVVVFHSTNCQPCIAIAKIVEEIKPQWDAKINFVDVLTDQETDYALVEEYAIDTIPCSVFFDASGKQIDRVIGVIEKEEFATRFASMAK